VPLETFHPPILAEAAIKWPLLLTEKVGLSLSLAIVAP